MQTHPLKSATSKHSPFPDAEKVPSKNKTVNVFFKKTLTKFASAFLKVLKG